MNKYLETIDYIKSIVSMNPETAIILGSGLGRLANEITDSLIIPYIEIPNFPISTAPGHKGNLIFGYIGNKKVVAMQGRFHYYEGYSMDQVTFPIRIFAKLGIKNLIVTNAAGGVNLSYDTGDLMIIKDHICFTPNPLIGKNLDEFGTRFPDMSLPYDKDLRVLAHNVADELGIRVTDGVYVNLTGPSFETVAEVTFLRLIGADAVGMSTVPEVIVARHCGMRVFGMSVITNKATNADPDINYNGQSVLEEADKAADKMICIVKTMIERM